MKLNEEEVDLVLVLVRFFENEWPTKKERSCKEMAADIFRINFYETYYSFLIAYRYIGYIQESRLNLA